MQERDLYSSVVNENPVLSPEQERECLKQMHDHSPDDPEYQDAMETLILCNQRLVMSIARKFAFDSHDLDDLVQEGNLGLVRALEKYDYSKKKENGAPYRFTTYATWWITQSCQRFHENYDRSIRVPVHTRNEYVRLKKLEDKLTNELGREPTVDEIADVLPDNYPHGKAGRYYTELESINNIEDERPLFPDEEHRRAVLIKGIHSEKVNYIQQVQKMMTYTLSLNQTVGDENDTEIGELVADGKLVPSDLVNALAEKKVVQDVLETKLSPRERDVIKKRYGFEGKSYTLDAIAKTYGLTRERVRQIENRSLRKLTIAVLTDRECAETLNVEVTSSEMQKVIQMLCKYCSLEEDISKVRKLCKYYPDHCKFCGPMGPEGRL